MSPRLRRLLRRVPRGLLSALLPAAAAFAAGAAAAEDKPVVTVAFDLAVPRWQGQFGATQADFQARAAAAVAEWLSREVGFIAFKPGTAPSRQLVLHLEVAPDAGSKPFKETQLRLELVGHGPAPALSWVFRPDTAFGSPTGGSEAFVREIQLRLAGLDRQALVRQVLSRVPIASSAQLWKDPVGWVLPYRKAELCIDFRSVLRIENQVPSGAGQLVRDYMARASSDFAPRAGALAQPQLLGRLFTEALPAQDGLADLGAARPEAVAIRAVYVVEYLPLQPCLRPVPPEAVDFREGAR